MENAEKNSSKKSLRDVLKKPTHKYHLKGKARRPNVYTRRNTEEYVEEISRKNMKPNIARKDIRHESFNESSFDETSKVEVIVPRSLRDVTRPRKIDGEESIEASITVKMDPELQKGYRKNLTFEHVAKILDDHENVCILPL